MIKALLLSHPRNSIRDTQQCAGRHKLMKTRYPALRKLVDQELGITIQAGEHSSVCGSVITLHVVLITFCNIGYRCQGNHGRLSTSSKYLGQRFQAIRCSCSRNRVDQCSTNAWRLDRRAEQDEKETTWPTFRKGRRQNVSWRGAQRCFERPLNCH